MTCPDCCTSKSIGSEKAVATTSAADASTVGLLPRSLRPALVYLWRADGKTPPRPPAPTG